MKKKVLMLLLASLAGGASLMVLPVHAEAELVVEEIPDEAPPPVEPKRIYRHIGKDGSVVFSDEPVDGAQELEVKEPNSVNMRNPVIPVAPPTKPLQAPLQFSVRISSPQAGKHFQNHYEPVPVAVTVAPRPGPNHKLEVTDNGSPVPMTDGKFVIPLLTPGEHTLNARVVDENGETLGSAEPVVFYAHRASVNR